MRKIWRTGACGTLLGVTLALLPPVAAWAHTELESTNPRANATITKPVAAVALTFSGPIRGRSTTVTVTGPDGRTYHSGAVQARDTTVTQAIRPLPGGAVKVTWRTAAADGHPLHGSFAFTVAPSAAAPSPTTLSPTTPAQATVPPTTAPPTSAAAAEPAPVTATATGVAVTPAAQQTSTSGWMWLLVAGGGLVALAAGTLFRRSRSARRGPAPPAG